MVRVRISQDGTEPPVTRFALAVRGRVRRINDRRRGDYIEFPDCVLVPSRFSYLPLSNLFDHERHPCMMDVHVMAYPQIRVRFVEATL